MNGFVVQSFIVLLIAAAMVTVLLFAHRRRIRASVVEAPEPVVLTDDVVVPAVQPKELPYTKLVRLIDSAVTVEKLRIENLDRRIFACKLVTVDGLSDDDLAKRREALLSKFRRTKIEAANRLMALHDLNDGLQKIIMFDLPATSYQDAYELFDDDDRLREDVDSDTINTMVSRFATVLTPVIGSLAIAN